MKAYDRIIRLFCALALLAVAFGHQPLRLSGADAAGLPAPNLSAPDLSAYALPDGSLPVLCLELDVPGSNGGKHGKGFGCEACRLTAAFSLAFPPALPLPKAASARRLGPSITGIHLARAAFPPAAPPTAPPLV